MLRISTYCRERALERRGKPVEDLLGALGNAVVNGRLWTDEEIAFNGILLVLGGIDTTRTATAGAMLEFIRNPDELARLKGDPALMRTTVMHPYSPIFTSLCVMTLAAGPPPARDGDTVPSWCT